MITYFVCLLIGLLGIALVFRGKNELTIVIGGAFYFIALFGAAIHSMHGALI